MCIALHCRVSAGAHGEAHTQLHVAALVDVGIKTLALLLERPAP